MEAFLEVAERRYRLEKRASAHLLQSVLEEVGAAWEQQAQLAERAEELAGEARQAREERAVLRAGERLFGERLQGRGEQGGRIGLKCGVIGKQEEAILRRTLFRMTKGLSIYESVDLEAVCGEGEGAGQAGKTAFFLILGSGQSRALSSKVERLLENYGIRSYDYPRSGEEWARARQAVEERAERHAKVAGLLAEQVRSSLAPLLEVQYSENSIKFSRIEFCKLFLLHERKTYQRLNQMKPHAHFYEAQVFVEAARIDLVAAELTRRLAEDQMPAPQLIPQPATRPPTLFPLNEVTRTPYEVLCGFGVPRYKEANPALVNLTTFPFLFGVMFGDVGHGALLLGAAVMMFWGAEHHPLLRLLHPHRHTLALMGFFSIYCGLIYNEYLSLALNLFGSCYPGGVRAAECVYPVGVDPVWSVAVNGLSFTNSLKMKISVIIAVVHMAGGLAVKALNCWRLGSRPAILLQVLPQAVFLLSLFGYMDLLIVYKWLHRWLPATAPSIITTMINIPL